MYERVQRELREEAEQRELEDLVAEIDDATLQRSLLEATAEHVELERQSRSVRRSHHRTAKVLSRMQLEDRKPEDPKT